MTPQNCVTYCRVSSKDQEREGFSIPAQRKLLQGYARDRCLTIAREFVDIETAKQAGRGGFADMVTFLKATPSCRVILVEKTDRLYRNFRDYVTLEDLNVAVHFVKENTVLSPKQRHAFMGLLKCARCGCAMTAEKKKGKYIYYRCTGFRGACGNAYIREERLADLLGDTIAPIQITSEIAAGIADALRTGDADVEQRRTEAIRQLEQRRRTVTAKLDRGYDDFVSGEISGDLWKRKSAEWEADLLAVETELARAEQPKQPVMATAEKILELAQKAVFLYKSQDRAEQRRLLEIVLSNCTFDRGSLSPTYNSPFDLLVRGNKSGNWR
jgi:hypothetical protein